MDDQTNLARLRAILSECGCQIDRARCVWALNSELTDMHVAALDGWAELEFCMADGTQLTDDSLRILRSFPLTDLSIGETKITADAFLDELWTNSLQSLGIHGIDFSGKKLDSLMFCRDLTVVNANDSHLSLAAVTALAQLPKMSVLEAHGADLSSVDAQQLCAEFRRITFRFSDGIWRDGRLINPAS